MSGTFQRVLVVATATGAVVGAVWGLIAAIAAYPLSSWPGVVLYVALLGTVAGALLGSVAGLVVAGSHRVRRRQGRRA